MAATVWWHCMLALLVFAFNGERGGITGTDAGKILGVFYIPAHGHFVMFERLMKELAARGHQVTVVSHFPQPSPIVNYTDVSVVGTVPKFTGKYSVETMMDFDVMKFLFEENVDMCEKLMSHPNVQRLIESPDNFDLAIVQVLGADCGYGLAWKKGASVIAISSLSRMPWTQFRVGNPENPSYFPLAYTPYSYKMNFWERFHNLAKLLQMLLYSKFKSEPAMDEVNRKILGPAIPPLEDLLYNTSAIFLNSHFSLNGALPAVPAVVDVGGLHVSPIAKPLPQPLRDWLDGADASGVVYVSFGSLVRAEQMSVVQLKGMATALGSLEQRVMWKCDGEMVAQTLGSPLPPNILTAPWMPQADVLAHPKVRAFVSHGGLMGTQEAVYWGKPMIVMPLFADQFQNSRNLVERGMALELRYHDINEESLRKHLRIILDNPSFMENARRLSRLFRDRPRPPLQEAVFWTEYVMRHRGAPHMQSAAIHLRWWQLLLLDVAAAALAAVAAALAAALLLFRCLCHRPNAQKVKQN